MHECVSELKVQQEACYSVAFENLFTFKKREVKEIENKEKEMERACESPRQRESETEMGNEKDRAVIIIA